MPSLRCRDIIQSRLETLKNNPVPDTDVELNARGWNVEEMKRRDKIEVLEWVLHDWRSPVEIYCRYRELENTGTAFDEEGDRAEIRVRAKKEALKWVMKGNPADPRTFSERVEHAAEEVLYLGNDADSHTRDETDTTIELSQNTDFDAEYLEEELHEVWRSLRDIRSHLVDDHDN